jgi:hypothetical protein
MTFFEFIISAINSNLIIAFSIIGILLTAFITIRYNEIKTKKDKFEKAYSAFKEVIDHTIYQIKSGDTLNVVILGAYPNHETAMTNFVPKLKGFRRKRFKNKWNEYATHYDQLKSMGHPAFAACAAILPYENCPTDPASLDRYERERRVTLLNVYKDLLEIGNKRIWY